MSKRIIDCTTGYDSHFVHNNETVFIAPKGKSGFQICKDAVQIGFNKPAEEINPLDPCNFE